MTAPFLVLTAPLDDVYHREYEFTWVKSKDGLDELRLVEKMVNSSSGDVLAARDVEWQRLPQYHDLVLCDLYRRLTELEQTVVALKNSQPVLANRGHF